MSEYSRHQIRAAVVFGFALRAAGAFIYLVVDVESVGYSHSFQGILDSLINPLATIAAVYAWWWLTRLEPRDAGQLRILRFAYLFFLIQYLLIAVGYNVLFTPIRSFGGGWITAYLWLDFLGAVIVTLGMLLMFRFLGATEEIERPVAEVEEVSQ